jgi:penicillin-binding protein 1C
MFSALIRRHKTKSILVIVTLVALTWYVYCMPDRLFNVKYSTVLLDRDGNLLNASIAPDGQWRFPLDENVPSKFAEALVEFEDKRFFKHPGVDPLAFARAVKQNVAAGKVISGASTISMQVVRLSSGNPDRNIFNKLIELAKATRLEWRHSKTEIIALYAAHAPFGGNVVGIDAACWRYFGHRPDELSWGEAALLAVLPNNPSLMHIGRNRDQLLRKRDRLLRRLHHQGKFDELSLNLALAEPLPTPLQLPRLAPHLLDRAIADGHLQERILSSVKTEMQERVRDILLRHHERLKGNQVFNAAALVLDVKTGKVLAYHGNVPSGRENHEQVDVVRSVRSTGSILKPFLFAAMLDEGLMLRGTLLPDVPTIINGFSPKNFSGAYDGAVAADQALIRSLNIPAVHELRQFRYEKFHSVLKDIGINSLTKPADHYGLSMILGGAESSLWQITGAYASMARTLDNYSQRVGSRRYHAGDIHSPMYLQTDTTAYHREGYEASSVFSAAALWQTMEALSEVYRPGEETGWRNFYSSGKIAWKTGTSYGFRDGWAVGVTADYAVGVWVGNADGEGRPGLTGTDAAAPVMFDIFSQLSSRRWFTQPFNEMEEVEVCKQSGQRISSWCATPEKKWISKSGLKSKACPFHVPVHLTVDGKHRIHTDCESITSIKTNSWFVLPPVMEYYFKARHMSYRSLPPFRSDCADPSVIVAMDLIYPKAGSKIFIPRELDGEPGRTVFQVAHRDPSATVYWHLDGKFVGATQVSHRLPLAPSEGTHEVTLVDEQGIMINQRFEVFSRK